MKPTETTEYRNAVNMKDMLEDTRRIACDFIVSSERGGSGYTDPQKSLDAIVELLAGISCVEDHFRDIIDRAHEARRDQETATTKQ